MSKNDISEDTLQNITKGVTFSQSISSIFRVTFSLAVDMFEQQRISQTPALGSALKQKRESGVMLHGCKSIKTGMFPPDLPVVNFAL